VFLNQGVEQEILEQEILEQEILEQEKRRSEEEYSPDLLILLCGFLLSSCRGALCRRRV
jgi:hypothetical protein